jgi:hypothetical protein
MNTYILDDHHKPVPVGVMRWTRWWNRRQNRRVVRTLVGPYRVSTVFTGLDNNWTGKGLPILFETMVYRHGNPCGHTPARSRYTTWEAALAGHNAAVREWRKKPD